MICPYANEVGDPALRSNCPAKDVLVDGQCLCDREMAQLNGAVLTDPQSVYVTNFWVARDIANLAAEAESLRTIRPDLSF